MYSKIHPLFWRKRKIKQEPVNVKFLMTYLLTGPNWTILGMYYLAPTYGQEDTSLKPKDYQKAMDRLG